MRRMIYWIAAAIICVIGCVVSMGCHSCKPDSIPADISDCRLTYYSYNKSGTTALPLRYEKVELCEDDSSRCIIRLFEYTDNSKVSEQGMPIEDTVVADRQVLDKIKELIVEAKAWEFKENYSPRYEVMDGESWSFTTFFDVSAEQLAKAEPNKRARLRRHGGRILRSSGSNAKPDTDLFDNVRDYLYSLLPCIHV